MKDTLQLKDNLDKETNQMLIKMLSLQTTDMEEL